MNDVAMRGSQRFVVLYAFGSSLAERRGAVEHLLSSGDVCAGLIAAAAHPALRADEIALEHAFASAWIAECLADLSSAARRCEAVGCIDRQLLPGGKVV